MFYEDDGPTEGRAESEMSFYIKYCVVALYEQYMYWYLQLCKSQRIDPYLVLGVDEGRKEKGQKGARFSYVRFEGAKIERIGKWRREKFGIIQNDKEPS
ncbi:hypothetical protein EVAR_97595_1 [Eumeta japonica]|uniref:Uncharacterized protein n=1 Tax=Eumeta variegata TaxID=151549 RepID=A0A4C1XJH6_EUMVA|nr:hypothetical protein EVAR_97595_1 [Eumeta japonica]